MLPLSLTLPQLVVIVGFILILAELIVGIQAGFDLVLIGSILVIGGMAGELTNSFLLTLLLSAILSGAYIAFGRSLIKDKITVLTHKTNIDNVIGKKGVVIRSITPDTPGMVRVADEDWRAISDTVLYEKDRVEVVAVEGVSLKVVKVR